MKAWGGRFQKEAAALVDEFQGSIQFDQRLAEQDLRGSMAHARMLGEQGIISPDEAAQIIAGLQRIQQRIGEGTVDWDPAAEDIHLNIEQQLVAEIGAAAQKLHTARSRNDQVALDLRLYLGQEIGNIQKLLQKLLSAVLNIAQAESATILPGYTHLQRAQPVVLAHHLLAYFEMLRRDYQRLTDCQKRVGVSPLGSGALAGTGFPIEREQTAQELGLAEVSANSMDAVSDRDFVAEFIFVAALIMMHLSRWCEELVLWSSSEFGFVELDDAYTTGSSIMPQKKNPDLAELIRGKTGRVYGALVTMLTILKGLPLTYNKDLQEDKPALFDTIDTLTGCLQIFTPMLESAVWQRQRMLEATASGFLNATDLADYLVTKGVAFREAHQIVGQLVRYCIDQEKQLEQLSLAEFQKYSPLIEADLYPVLQIQQVVAARQSYGGTAPEQVKLQLAAAAKWLKSLK